MPESVQTPVTCPGCGHVSSVKNATGLEAEAFVSASILRCDECGARIVYGKLAPRIAVLPLRDERGRGFCRVVIQDPKTKETVHELMLDPQYAATLAKNILSVVVP